MLVAAVGLIPTPPAINFYLQNHQGEYLASWKIIKIKTITN